MSCLTNKQLHTFLILTQQRHMSPANSTFIMASGSHPGTQAERDPPSRIRTIWNK